MAELNPNFFFRNVTDITELLKYSNDLSGNLYIPLFLVAMWIIVFAASQNAGNVKSFSMASIFTFTLSIFFVGLGLINSQLIVIPLFLVAVSGFLIWKERE